MILCDICKKAEAYIHWLKIENGLVHEVHYCPQCEKDLEQDNQTDLSPDALPAEETPVENKTDHPPMHPSHKKEFFKPGLACPVCGLTYQRFKEIGRLGCPECYDAFREGKEGMPNILRKIHGSTRHQGKYPKHQEEYVLKRQQIVELRQQLAASHQ